METFVMVMFLLMSVVVVASVAINIVSNRRNRKHNKLLHTSFRNALDDILRKSETMFSDLTDRILHLERTVETYELRIHQLEQKVYVQSHIINSVSPRIKLATQHKSS
jgi:CII-binding regulator of phage lambda lysogenization HflD